MAERVRQCPRGKRTRVLRHLYFTSGRHYWEVLVERVADPRTVFVGVAPSEKFETGATEQTVGYAATGEILHSGEEVCRAQAFAVGDTVGVYLDMNAQQVAFFLNDEAQLDPSEGDQVTTAGGEHGERTDGPLMNGDPDLEMKAPVCAVDARRVAWYSFHSRAMFAAVGCSSRADSLAVVGADVPDGYR
ncbi:hypothetical protein PRIC1_011009 [Phytophthora ramorum]